MKCILCGNDELRTLTERIRSGPGLVRYCPDCGLGMLDAEAGNLQEYYDGEYRRKYGPELGKSCGYDEIFEAHVGYQRHRIELLRPHLGPDKRLLEVGCSTGHFLFHVKDLVGEACGADFDAQAVEYARTRCGIRTFGGNLLDSDFEKGSFDLVCAYQTLEHVPDPVAFVSMLAAYLKPGGVLVVEVPNLRDPLLALYANEAYRPFYYHEAHLFYFTEDALKATMARAGLSGEVHFIQDYNLMNHLHWSLTNTPQPNCSLGLGPDRLPVSPDADPGAVAELQAWFADVGAQYKAILARHKLTDNMTFIGRADA